MRYLTSGKEIINLLEEDHIFDANGIIKMTLNSITVVVKQNDTVGNILQEWLGEYLRSKDVYFRPPQGQTFPDFYLSDDDNKHLCEMKSFVSGLGPGFDIANFFGYIDSLKSHGYRLDADYLVFAYTSDDDGVIKINNMWCKKVWEIAGPAGSYPLNCQRKKGQIYNIRPVRWMSKRPNVLKPFASKEEFVAALYKTYLSSNNQRRVTDKWLDDVVNSYEIHSGADIKSQVLGYIR
jgi:type II restriction enzyme